MRIRKLYNGTGPTGDPKKKKPITPAVANPLLAPKYLLSNQNTFNTVGRIVDAIESGQDVMYGPDYADAIAQERKLRKRQRMTEPVDYTGRVQSTAPVAEFLTPVGDLLAAGEGAGMVAQGVKEGDLSKIGMGTGLSLGAIAMALVPGNLQNFRAFANAQDNRVIYHIHDIIEDSQRSGTDLTPDMVMGQLEAARYSPEELADAGMTLDEFTDAGAVGSGPGEFMLSRAEETNLDQLAMMMDPNIEIAGVLDNLLVNGNPAYFEGRLSPDVTRAAMEQYDQIPANIQRRIEQVGTNIPSNPRAVDNSVSREAREEMYSILENHYGGNIPEEIALEVGVHPVQMQRAGAQIPERRSIIAEQYGVPEGSQGSGISTSMSTNDVVYNPMTFRGEEVGLPKSVSHFELNDRTVPNQPYAPSRFIDYDTTIPGSQDGISMRMSPLEYLASRPGSKYESFADAYPDAYVANIGMADTRRGREISKLIDEAEEELKTAQNLPSTLVDQSDITRLEQKIYNLKSMGPSSSRDVFAMMTKMFDEIKTGDVVDPGSLSTDSYGMWLRQIDKGNKYLKQGGKKQGAKLIPEDKVPLEDTINFKSLNNMGEFTNTFKLPKEMADLFNRYDMLTGQGTGSGSLRTHLMNEGMTVDDVNAMMMEAKEKYIDPALAKRGLPPVQVLEAGSADMYPGTQSPIFFKFPLPYLEKLYKGGRIKLLKKRKKGMRVKK
tara:strand:+ start:587 stop:2740 length:2154 start_codon:yes stop_codon:yes gene_type:complete